MCVIPQLRLIVIQLSASHCYRTEKCKYYIVGKLETKSSGPCLLDAVYYDIVRRPYIHYNNQANDNPYTIVEIKFYHI